MDGVWRRRRKGGGGEEGVVRRSSAVELLPLRRRGSGGRRGLLPAGLSGAGVARSLLHLLQRLARGHGNGRRPAVAAVEPEVVLGHGSSSEGERGRRRRRRESVSVLILFHRPGAPLSPLLGLLVWISALWRSGVPPPARVIPLSQAEFPIEFGHFLLPGGKRLCGCVAPGVSLVNRLHQLRGGRVDWIKS